MNTKKKLLLTATIAGLVAGFSSTAFAGETTPSPEPSATEKAGCHGKDEKCDCKEKKCDDESKCADKEKASCSGKDGCDGKMKK